MAQSPESAANSAEKKTVVYTRYTRITGVTLFILMLAVAGYSYISKKIEARAIEQKRRNDTLQSIDPEFIEFSKNNLPNFDNAVPHQQHPKSALITPDGTIAFDTTLLAGDIDGFNGPLRILAVMRADGTLEKFVVAEHTETPSYFQKTNQWCASLHGRNICHSGFTGGDTVSGATYTSKGILDTLNKAALKLTAASAESRTQTKEMPSLAAEHRPFTFDWHGIYLISAILAAIVCRFIPDKRLRYLALATNLILGGWWLGAQFSTFHVLNLAKFQLPPVGLTPVFICFAGLPLIMLFTGNIYCGWICPFGALQELSTLSGRARANPKNGQPLRFVKYIILCVVLGLYWLGGNQTLLEIDPLNFAYTATTTLLITAGVIFALAQFLPVRFFCRYLCPTGAFLSLFNRIFLLKKFFPYIMPGKCDLGIKSIRETDCLLCDRCRNGCVKAAKPSGEKK